MNEKNTQYGLTNNPISEDKPKAKPRVTMADRIKHSGYQVVTIDGEEYELLDRKAVEDMTDKIERLERSVKRAETRLQQLTNTVRSVIKDQESTEKIIKKITKI